MENLKVIYRKKEDLSGYKNNARTHNETQVKQIAASIKEFGFTNPILIDENDTIIAGHGRLMAAEMLGLGRVPTITLDGLSDEQRRAYIIADNKLALNAGWDYDILKFELERLEDTELLPLIGFAEEELEHIKLGWETDLELGEGGNELEGLCKFMLIGDHEKREEIIEKVKAALAGTGIEFREAKLGSGAMNVVL